MSGRPANCTSNEHFKPNPSVSTLPSNSSKKTCPPTSDNFCKSVPLYEGGGGRFGQTLHYFLSFFLAFQKSENSMLNEEVILWIFNIGETQGNSGHRLRAIVASNKGLGQVRTTLNTRKKNAEKSCIDYILPQWSSSGENTLLQGEGWRNLISTIEKLPLSMSQPLLTKSNYSYSYKTL